MDYDDLDIRIVPDGSERYQVLAAGPEGEARGPFRPGEIEGSVSVVPPGGVTRDAQITGVSRSAASPARELGGRLFQALFPGEIRHLLERCRSVAEEGGRGLRIRLRIDPTEPRLARLATLPWELLYSMETGFLLLNRTTPVVRSLDTPRPSRPLSFQTPLRILALLSNPEGLPGLDLDQEQRGLLEACGTDGSLEVAILENPTLASLRRQILSGPYHVLHFMGHGSFEAETNTGYLLFETEDGLPDAVRDEVLASLLQSDARPRLIVFNACETAASGTLAATGVAAALVRAGVPAIIAMRVPISDRAAIKFSKVFYARLAANDSIEAAMAEARMAIYCGDPDSGEWATPILFLRTSDPKLSPSEDRPESEGYAETLVRIAEFESHQDAILAGEVNDGVTPPASSEMIRTIIDVGKGKSTGDFIVGGRVNRKGAAS